jgi:hypothetical protein
MAHDIPGWGPVAVFAIFVLFAAAMKNRAAARKPGWTEWSVIVSHNTHSPIATRAKTEPRAPKPRVHLDNTCTQLIRLAEALGVEDKVRTAAPDTGGARGSADRLPRIEEPASDIPQYRAFSEPTDNSGMNRIGSMLPNEPARNYLIAFALVLAATILGYGTLLLKGTVPMGFFVVAVIIAAGRGTATGLLAMALSLVDMIFVFSGHISVSTATQNMIALFLLIGILTTFVFHNLNLRHAALGRAKAEVEAVNLQLRNQTRSLAKANSTLAEQKAALFKAHEDLRFLSKQLTDRMQIPLRRISVTTEKLVGANTGRFDPRFSEASGELIKVEIKRMDELMADLARTI